MRLSGTGLRAASAPSSACERQAGLEMVGERPADDLARKGVEDDGEIDEGLRQTNVGDVGDPDLIEAGGLEPAHEVGPDRVVVFAHRGLRNERFCPQRQEVVFAHEPRHALVVDDHAAAEQLALDPSIAVMAILERDAVNEIAQAPRPRALPA